MSNPFAQNGAMPDKQSKFAPLYVKEFWTGLYTNRNPLREGAVPFLYQKFYSGARFDSFIAGSNVEISPRLTPIRRYGNSVYNSATFPAINGFYAFRVFDSTTQTEKIKVIADSGSFVFDATGPSTKTTLFTKLTGAGQTSFQSLGNTLYAADGVSAWKWVWAPAWRTLANYSNGNVILDSSNNLQQAKGTGLSVANTAIATNVLTVNYTGSATIKPGDVWTFWGLTANPTLNGQSVTILTVGGGAFTASYAAADYTTLSDTGIVANAAGTGTSGNAGPTFSGTIGSALVDGTVGWVSHGSSVQTWGITAPSAAPSVANVFYSTGTAWAASTYYWPIVNGVANPIVVDSNNNIQLLTTAGTTAGAIPVWAVSGTTADGSAVWTFQGAATRAASHSYALGSYIAVTVTTTIRYPIYDSHGNFIGYGYASYSNFYFFKATVAGVSSSFNTTSLSWPSGLGGTMADGTVTWQNVGYQVTHTNAANSSPTSVAQGNVSVSTLVSLGSSIVDDLSGGGGTGFVQNCTIAGKSGAAHPTWATSGGQESSGLLTTDNGLIWTNGGPSGVGNTGAWTYGFSFGNSVTGHESSMSPASAQILLGSQSAIAISGSGDPNYLTDGVDTINIYRTTQGVTSPLFRLTSIPAPTGGVPWSFTDTTPDPPNPGATLNEFIKADTTGNNAPPPAGLTAITYYLGRIVGAKGVFAYYSGVATQPVGVGAESFPALNFMQFPEIVSRPWASATGLLIFTNYGVFFSQGVDGNGNPNSPVMLLEDIGLLSPNCFTVNGSIPAIFTSDKQLLTLDPSSGVSRVSEPIADILAGLSATGSYLTWHTNGTDQAYFIADGSTGWYRLAPTAPPENGLTWSPKATIVGGVKCVQSIETTPGSKTLLLGPTSSGPILKRDLTLNQDNGSSYTASFTIGSLVLAEPNQCAEVMSITTEAKAVGSHPTVSILGDEISGTFERMATAVNDPPFLNTPLTVYPDRWYFNQLTKPAWLRHLQIQIAWPAENFANELLSFALYGCVHTE